MGAVKINFGKIAFLLCNFIFLVSGICLVLLGCALLNDAPRILLSRLFVEPGTIAQPLLYYVALALIAAGLAVSAVSMLGCWASCQSESNCLMGFFMFLLVVLLVAETSLGAVAGLCPQIMGVASDREQMVAGLMNNYGVPGRSQYTAAVDLAQTLLECCGMQSGSDYDGSKWWKREQETRHDLRVPRSCCFLSNTNDEASFLDPKPINSSLCQAKTNSKYQHGRHVKGCVDKLNVWFKEHVTIFLTIGLALVIVQLAVFLCALLLCLRRRDAAVASSSSSTPNSSVARSTPTPSKKHRRSDKNLTPRPERKTIQTVEDDVCLSNGKFTVSNGPVEPTFNYTLKKLNLDHDLGVVRGRDSPSTLPLVLKNDHFQRFDERRPNKQIFNSVRANGSVPAGTQYHHVYHDHGSNVYFTPRYDPTVRGQMFCNHAIVTEHNNYSNNNNDDDEDDGAGYNLDGELKTYFCSKSDKYGLDNVMYESCQDT